MVAKDLLKPRKRRVLFAFIALPLILATIVLGSLELGQWIEGRLGLGSNLLFELAFTLLGFLLALLLITRLADWIVRAEAKVAVEP